MKTPKPKLLNFETPVKETFQIKIFRYISFKQLSEMISKSKNRLSSIESWGEHDPFENVFFKLPYIDKANNNEEIGMRALTDNFYGQCWTLSRESHLMWEMYRDRYKKQEGVVKIESTIEKVFNSHEEEYFKYIGVVEYLSKKQLVNRHRDFRTNLTTHLITDSGQGISLAKHLLIKRQPYRSEEEVRFLIMDPKSKEITPRPKIHSYDIMPNVLINKVVFDPRVEFKEYKSRKKKLVDLGFKQQIIRSKLYTFKEEDFLD